MLISPDQTAMRRLNKLGFTELGHAYYGWVIAVNTAVVRISIELNIPLIFYGENNAEYGNSIDENETPKMDKKFFSINDPGVLS